jgi:hypothetical protein
MLVRHVKPKDSRECRCRIPELGNSRAVEGGILLGEGYWLQLSYFGAHTLSQHFKVYVACYCSLCENKWPYNPVVH